MPDIRGIYYTNPSTGAAGLWVVRGNGTIVGRTDAEIAAYIGKTGGDAQKIERLRAALQAYLQAGMEDTISQAQFFAGWVQADIDAWIAAPPQYYRIENNNVVVTNSVVTIEVFSVSPLRYQITISCGASGIQNV